jgi:hypothetical protein
MHLLYLDEAGSSPNVSEEYLVLGGISVYEAQAYHIVQELDRLAVSIDPSNPDNVEFHASEIFSRRIDPWKKMSKAEAQGIIKAVLNVFVCCYESARSFACAIHKTSFSSFDPIELAFEDLCQRFDLYLNRLRSDGDRQRGLIILDQSSYETNLQKLALGFRHYGTKWGVIKNLADTPLFVNSKASRVIQLADHISYAVFRRYNAGDTQYFDLIASKFDSYNGVLHGLSHKHNLASTCMCPACITRRSTSIL